MLRQLLLTPLLLEIAPHSTWRWRRGKPDCSLCGKLRKSPKQAASPSLAAAAEPDFGKPVLPREEETRAREENASNTTRRTRKNSRHQQSAVAKHENTLKPNSSHASEHTRSWLLLLVVLRGALAQQKKQRRRRLFFACLRRSSRVRTFITRGVAVVAVVAAAG